MRCGVVMGLAVLLLAACKGGEADTTMWSTTTSSAAVTTTVATTTATTTTTTTLPPLVDSYGLGWGFHLGAADETVGLFVELVTEQDFYDGRIPEVSVLPNHMWEAEVRIGFNLFANWGNEAIMASDPVPVVDEVWPIVAGTITILEMRSTDEDGITRARLEGVEAVIPDGTRVRLGDFEVENGCWGCFVG
jgi:hypothetical protein